MRVDEVGRAEAVTCEAATARADPLDPTTKYFLNRFIADFHSRRRATVEEQWARSLRFLSTELANAAFASDGAEVAAMAAGTADTELQADRALGAEDIRHRRHYPEKQRHYPEDYPEIIRDYPEAHPRPDRELPQGRAHADPDGPRRARRSLDGRSQVPPAKPEGVRSHPAGRLGQGGTLGGAPVRLPEREEAVP